MGSTPHTSTCKGKRVYVRLRSGERFIDKFMDRKGNFVVFQERGRVRTSEIKAFSINRNVENK